MPGKAIEYEVKQYIIKPVGVALLLRVVLRQLEEKLGKLPPGRWRPVACQKKAEEASQRLRQAPRPKQVLTKKNLMHNPCRRLQAMSEERSNVIA